MSSTDSAIARKVDDILRNQWTIYFGFSGRHAPDLVDDMLRIMHFRLTIGIYLFEELCNNTHQVLLCHLNRVSAFILCLPYSCFLIPFFSSLLYHLQS